MISNYAYIVWSIIILTSWLSLLMSMWIAIIDDTKYFWFAVFWFIITFIVAAIPSSIRK